MHVETRFERAPAVFFLTVTGERDQTDLARLRVQETERVRALHTELTKCGVKVIEADEAEVAANPGRHDNTAEARQRIRHAREPTGWWSLLAISRWMKDKGVSTGFGDGTYRPADAVTRQAMSAFMQRVSALLP